MEGLPTWGEMQASLDTGRERLRDQAWSLHAAMTAHVEQEISRTGAEIVLAELGTTLSKHASQRVIEMRLGVDYATALCARQTHVTEAPGEKTRSWRINLDLAPVMPANLREGLTKVVETVARLQGLDVPRHQPELGL